MANGRLVTIAHFTNTFDVELAKVTLENEGIECVIIGDYLNMVQPYIQANAIQLQVFEADARRALEVLAEVHDLPEEPEEGEQ